LKLLFERIAVPMVRAGTRGAWFGGLRMVAIDGLVFDVPDTPPANDEEFGVATEAALACRDLSRLSLKDVLVPAAAGHHGDARPKPTRRAMAAAWTGVGLGRSGGACYLPETLAIRRSARRPGAPTSTARSTGASCRPVPDAA